ncbi:MAG: amino acid ABC transporter substrate-binding protein [Alteromonadales bacterium]|nr:amino acid ABC transporter substrate-binding protein [Alteromonadales bacterium]
MKALLILILVISSLSARAGADDIVTISYHNFPPFSYQESKKAQGVMVELVTEVCRNAQLSCKFKYYPNRRAKSLMSAGVVTANIPLGWNADRAKTMWFSVPLLNTEYGFYGKQGENNKYHTVDDINGKTVGVFGPSNTETTLNSLQQSMQIKGLSPIQIEVMPNVNEHGIEKLLKDRYQLYFVNKHVGEYLINKHNIQGVEYIGSTHQLGYFVGFAKAHVNPKLIRRFNQSIIQLYKNNGFVAIYKKWQVLPGNYKAQHLTELDILH